MLPTRIAAAPRAASNSAPATGGPGSTQNQSRTSKTKAPLTTSPDSKAEPAGGAHCNPELAAENLKTAVTRELRTLIKTPIDKLLDQRYEKFRAMGVFQE